MSAPKDVGPVGQADHPFFGLASQGGKCSKWLEDKNAYCDLPASAHPASRPERRPLSPLALVALLAISGALTAELRPTGKPPLPPKPKGDSDAE